MNYETKTFFGLTEIANTVSGEVADCIKDICKRIEDKKAAYFAVERELKIAQAVGWNGKLELHPRGDGSGRRNLENKLKDLVAVHLLTEQMLKMKEELK